METLTTTLPTDSEIDSMILAMDLSGSWAKVADKVLKPILKKMKDGTMPWQQEWIKTATDMPKNLVTGAYYTGMNVLILLLAKDEAGYKTDLWMTASQAKREQKVYVKKGEKATACVRFVPRYKEQTKEEKAQDKPKEILYMMPKVFYLFNVEQFDGAEYEVPEPTFSSDVSERFEALRGLLERYHASPEGPGFDQFGNGSNYSPDLDRVKVALQFKTEAGFYADWTHEVIHSTGHESRLDRKEIKAGRDVEPYSKEELVAELGSAFLMMQFGVSADVDNTAAYVNNWFNKLAGSPKLLFSAAGKAMQAVNYVMKF